MCAARVRPERPERLVRQDAACASGRIFFFLMPFSDADEVEPVFQVLFSKPLGTLQPILNFLH